jgi:chitin disaccharide deacetylase
MKRVRLLTRADDAGMNRTINRAIFAAAEKGIVRNISVMASTPEIEDAAAILLKLKDTVDFGLHVTLTAEWYNLRWGPISDVDAAGSLVLEDGTFPVECDGLAELSPDVDEMMREVEAQYTVLADLGFPIKYMDEHMGVGQVAGLHERLVEFAAEKKLLYDRALRECGKYTRLPGWSGPGEHPGTELADHLAGVEPGTYLIVGHPGNKTDEMEYVRKDGQPKGEVMMQRNRQRRMFMDIEIVDYCENVHIELLRYSALQ